MIEEALIVAILQIIAIDIILGGDNAIIIALACRNLPQRQKRLGILWGTAGAIILREAPALLGDGEHVDWTWRGLLDGLQQITDDTVDCLVLYVCRSVLLIFLGWLAERLGD